MKQTAVANLPDLTEEKALAIELIVTDTLLSILPESSVLKVADDPLKFSSSMFTYLVRAWRARLVDILPPQIAELVNRGIIRRPDGTFTFDDIAFRRFHEGLDLGLGVQYEQQVRGYVHRQINTMYETAKKVSAERLVASPKLTDVDRGTIRYLRGSSSFYIRSAYNRRFVPAVTQEAIAVVNEGYGALELRERLRQRLTGKLNQSATYYSILADQVMNKARNASNIRLYDQVGITEYEYVAVMDRRTTPQCRYMDGATLQVKDAVRQLDKEEEIGIPKNESDVNELKQTAPWMNFDAARARAGMESLYKKGPKGGRSYLPGSTFRTVADRLVLTGKPDHGKASRSGFRFPPLHGHCRSTTVARIA